MSLTSELKNPHSRVRTFMRERLPNTRRVMALSRSRMGVMATRRPEPPVPWSLIGTALDYRIRFYFPPSGRMARLENLICYLGAAKACGGKLSYDDDDEVQELMPPTTTLAGRLNHGLLEDFFESLTNCLRREPPQKRLDADAEDLLLRHCIVMAALDVFLRIGLDRRSVLLNPQPRQTVAELLAVAEQEWLHDLRHLSWTFHDGFSHLWTQPAVLNPTFDGSGFVGGADADLIVDGCLIDVKTTIRPLESAEWIYQLLVYALLDWQDAHKIKSVAVYFSRQGRLLEWEVEELLEELTGDVGVTLAGLRGDWCKMLTSGGCDRFGNDSVKFGSGMTFDDVEFDESRKLITA